MLTRTSSMHLRVELETGDVAEVHEAIRRGIRSADPPDVPPRDYRPVYLSLRDGDGRIVGGLHGATTWSWLMIDGLWVSDELRGQGLGSRLLAEAEALAVERGCRGSWLGTFDFQARGFYERHGYRVFAELPGFPEGHTHFHLRKDLAFSGISGRGAEPGEPRSR